VDPMIDDRDQRIEVGDEALKIFHIRLVKGET
jgi:hypothetical protein